MTKLGQRIQAARKAAGFTQASLAAACGWDPPSRLANYEQGTREPTLDDLRQIARHLRPESHVLAYAELVLDEAEQKALSQSARLDHRILEEAFTAAMQMKGGATAERVAAVYEHLMATAKPAAIYDGPKPPPIGSSGNVADSRRTQGTVADYRRAGGRRKK